MLHFKVSIVQSFLLCVYYFTLSITVVLEDILEQAFGFDNVLSGINRGIFGVPSEKKTEIEELVEVLESQNPTPQPTLCLEKVLKEHNFWLIIASY